MSLPLHASPLPPSFLAEISASPGVNATNGNEITQNQLLTRMVSFLRSKIGAGQMRGRISAQYMAQARRSRRLCRFLNSMRSRSVTYMYPALFRCPKRSYEYRLYGSGSSPNISTYLYLPCQAVEISHPTSAPQKSEYCAAHTTGLPQDSLSQVLI